MQRNAWNRWLVVVPAANASNAVGDLVHSKFIEGMVLRLCFSLFSYLKIFVECPARIRNI